MRTGKKKNGRRRIIIALAAALCLILTLPQLSAYAMDRVDTERECSLTIRTPESAEGKQVFSELLQTVIPVELYRVAEINTVGGYTVLEDFAGLDLSDIGSDTDAGVWEEKSAIAAGLAQSNSAVPVARIEVTEGKGTVSGLSTGMYLVCAETVQTAGYEYTFLPYLISLPTNDYYVSGSDEWQYDVTAGLKPERTDRYGDLVIEKELKSYNESLGEAVFVFLVEAVKDVEENGETVSKVVYSNVLTLNFTEPGMLTAVAEHIPADAVAMVTEVYSGASYELAEGTPGSYEVRIIASGDEGAPTTVRFTNDYEERLVPGTAVVNHFEYTGTGYEWKTGTDDRGTVTVPAPMEAGEETEAVDTAGSEQEGAEQ